MIAKSFNRHLSQVDRIFTHDDIFGLARAHFRTYGRPLNVKLGETPDIFHCTYPLPIQVNAAASIQTIHDLVPLRLPYLSDDNKRYHYRMLQKMVRRADHIVTVSETSRNDIIRMFGVDERRITNTYQAAAVPAAILARKADVIANELAGVFGLEWKDYFLFFGALEPKKNVMRLIESYLAARPKQPLVIVGAPGWNSSNEKELIGDARFGFYVQSDKRITYHRQIRHFDFVSYSLLVSLIRGARAVVFPSLYEGFGLPVLEAMQLGTPVISSTGGSLPEIAGSAAILVDPYNTDELTQAIKALAEDTELCGQLSEAGLRQAEQFTPARYQHTISSLYRKLLDGKT